MKNYEKERLRNLVKEAIFLGQDCKYTVAKLSKPLYGYNKATIRRYYKALGGPG